ncbi:MAG: outer membrane protein assembly factor BamA [Phycisphaeraceae bacterium]|nr:outer membrane protein assembly factor BamA [Phycisphaeraceae bacterium]
MQRLLVPILLLCLTAPGAWAAVDMEGRPIADIRIEGLQQVSDQFVRNQIRSQIGDPYDGQVVENDVIRITHLGVFESVAAQGQPNDDGTVTLIFKCAEQLVLADVQVVGNKAISDQELLSKVVLQAGDPADTFLIDRGKRMIREAYQDAGYFMASVSTDDAVLTDSAILIFRVVEGPKVKIRAFRFEGNNAFDRDTLKAQIKSDSYVPIFRDGSLSREQLELDASAIRSYYRDHGYLDAQVGRRIDLSPDQRGAVVVFQIAEGRQYQISQVVVEGNQQIPTAQISMNMLLHPGSTYSESAVAKSRDAILDLYGKLGYLETQVDIKHLFHDDQPRVDLMVQIDEGEPYTVGTIAVRGNSVTKSKVVLRGLRGLTPGERFDRTRVEETRRRLRESSLFEEGKVTILGGPEDEMRDVLVEVSEAQTGSISFGAAVSSDLGLVGAIDLLQKNFDISDTPENAKELFTGRAFRGAGQTFQLSLQPGDRYSRYAVNFTEPSVMETDYFLDTSVYLFSRQLENNDEDRAGLTLGVGQRFGDVWRASVQSRFYNVNINSVEPDAPVDVFAVEGRNLLTALGFVVTRDATDSYIFPTRGGKLELGLERAGALGGDFDFTRLRSKYDHFWTVEQDIFDRKTVLHWSAEVGWILESNEAPTFERYYAGGRSFRGFTYRGVGPRGIRADNGLLGDDPVGGEFMFLTSLEYEYPIYQELLRGVFFTDMGTVQSDVGFDEWRVSIGAGIRVRLPFLGPVPIALDLAVPVIKQHGDETQIISFDLSLPLQR